MLCRTLVSMLLVFLAFSADAREYAVSRSLPVALEKSAIGKVTLSLYTAAEGGKVLEVHQLTAGQWLLKIQKNQMSVLSASVDTQLPLPLWAELQVDGEPLAPRAKLIASGDLTAAGQIYSKSGFRFPDNSVQTSAANTQALDKLLGGSSSCPAGSSIRAIDASGNVTCEIDDADGSSGVTRINTGAGLSGGPITSTGTLSVATGGVTGAMIQDGSLGAADINTSQIQRRVSGSCPNGHMITGINIDGSLQCTSLYDLIPMPPRSFTVDSADDVGQFTSLVLDADGNPVISYYDSTHGDLKLIHCNHPYCSGDESVTVVDSVGDVGLFTSLALDVSGNPVISFYDVGQKDLKLARCFNADCTGFHSVTTVDAAGNVGRFNSLVLDVSGFPVISYADFSTSDLLLVHCNDPNCSGGNESIYRVDSVGTQTSLILDASGNPVISYFDSTNSTLKLVHCNDPDCSGGDESISSPDGTSFVGMYNSLMLDASGYPVISYVTINGKLKLIHCNDPNCNGGGESIVTVDGSAGINDPTSLALDANGHPVISYCDSVNGDLKLAYCKDANCNNKTLTIVDSAGFVGEFSSLALDDSDRPVISYYDATNKSLKVGKCGTQDCQ